MPVGTVRQDPVTLPRRGPTGGACRAVASAGVDEPVSSDPVQILKDLRATRRRQRISDFDPFEALYRAYLTGITLTMAVLLLSGVTGDDKVSAAEVASLRAHGGAVLGMAVALIFAIGFRSGGRGGPLVVEAADVRHVLLAPIDRSVALRGPAIRQLRFVTLVGTVAGGIAGLLAFRRLPGAPAGWIAVGGLVGAVSVAGGFGLAMIVSGRRLGRWVGGGLAIVVLAWSGLDVAEHRVTSPATLLGQVALWPLRMHVVDLLGPAVALAALVAGFLVVGGTSLEASERRAGLVGQIRFAATLQDLRTVIVLRRQLAQELPRQRPWIRLPRAIPRTWLTGGEGAQVTARLPNRWLPVWRRGWHGILRWPALRYARVAVMGVTAGLAMVGVWQGTTPLLVVAGLALYIAGLDATEPLAQEVDHPDRRAEYDIATGDLHLRQLGPPVVLMVAVGAIGLLAAAVVTGGATRTWEVGAVMLVPAVMCGLAAATVSVLKGTPPPVTSQAALIPEAAGARAMGRLLWPPILSVIGVLPILAARSAAQHGHPVLPAVVGIEQLVGLVVIGFLAWVRYQEDAHIWWANQMAEVKQASRGSGAT